MVVSRSEEMETIDWAKLGVEVHKSWEKSCRDVVIHYHVKLIELRFATQTEAFIQVTDFCKVVFQRFNMARRLSETWSKWGWWGREDFRCSPMPCEQMQTPHGPKQPQYLTRRWGPLDCRGPWQSVVS